MTQLCCAERTSLPDGDRRFDQKMVDAIVGKIARANAGFVKARTGLSIGGVSPVGHVQQPSAA